MKTITELAREAGCHDNGKEFRFIELCYLERFATLVRAQTLEEAAGVCDAQGHGRRALEHYASLTYAGAAHDCAAAIRQLKETK